MSAQAAVRVLVVDEEEVVRRGVSQVLADDPAITVVAEAASVAEAVARGLAVRPDVAVVGMRLPDGNGAEAWARLHTCVPGLRCLVLSAYCDPVTVHAAVRLGVSGYLIKHVRGPALVAAPYGDSHGNGRPGRRRSARANQDGHGLASRDPRDCHPARLRGSPGTPLRDSLRTVPVIGRLPRPRTRRRAHIEVSASACSKICAYRSRPTLADSGSASTSR